MKKADLAKYRKGTPEWVVAHGMWQHSRGRRPSERWGKITNPQKAFDAAMAALLFSEPMLGFLLEPYVRWMIEMANLVRQRVQTSFNGIQLTVAPGDRAESIVEAYRAERQRRYDAFWASPEGIKQARLMRSDVRAPRQQ